jgi:L-fuconolactonase
MIIDAHQHFWQRSLPFDYAWHEAPGMEPLRQDFLPADLAPLLQAAGVDGAVFVQTQHDLAENRWALGLAERHDWLLGVVGWVDLASPECAAQVEEFAAHPKFVGVRHITQDEPDDDFIVRPDVLRGLATLARHGVPFDLLFYVKHLRHAAPVARRFPDLPLAIDHLAKPRIVDGPPRPRSDGWMEALQAAAQCDNVYCKLSGMITEADWREWRPADLRPYVDAALEFFGPERCMFGSDWPVCLLAGSYQQAFDALCECIGELSEAERARILGGTAAAFYGLRP